MMREHGQNSFFLDRLLKGNAAYRAGRYQDAVGEYREAARLEPASVSAHSNLGRALAKVGLFEEAIGELESALKLRPEHGPSLYYLALCMDHKGLRERAVLAYEKFLRRPLGETPGYAEKARQRLEELKRAPPSPALKGPEGNLAKRASQDAAAARSESASATVQGWSVGQVVDDVYQVEELLGAGGFGSVHRVEHLGWHMKLAVKSPLKEKLADTRAQERFVQEANTWVGLGLHPNIVTCYFVRLIGGLPRIFMEYLEAGTLRRWLYQRQGVAVKATLDVAIQLARAMERVQHCGVVHRDLKPENCMMTPGGILKVTDFGLAKVGPQGDMPEAGRLDEQEPGKAKAHDASGLYRLGTQAYMAPEQWYRAGKAASAADVWAFGVMLYEMLHGQRPFQSLDDEPPVAFYLRMKEKRWGCGFRDDVPAEFKSIVSSCLVEDPDRREARFSVLRERLEALYAGLFKEPYPRPPIKQTPPLADNLSNQGVSMADLGRIDEALRLFTAALKQDPTHPGATYNRGILLMKQGRLRPAVLAARLDACKQARPWELAPEYLHRLVLLRDKDKETAVRELKQAQHIRDAPLIKRVLSFVEAGRPEAALELFVSPPTGAEAAMAEEVQFNSLLARARAEADAGQTGQAYQTLMAARDVKGYARAPLALSLQARLGRCGARMGLRAGWLRRKYEGSRGCLGADISPDGVQVISGHEDGMVGLWELETGRKVRALGWHGGPVKAVCFLPDMTAALSGGSDGAVKVWDLISGECVKVIEMHSGAVNAVCALPDGKRVLSAGDDGTLAIWGLEDGSVRYAIPAHQGAVKSVRLGMDGARAVSLGAEGLLKQWDCFKGCGICEHIDVGAAHALALSPDGLFALVVGDGWLAEWDLGKLSRRRGARLEGRRSPFRAAVLTSEGKFLMTGGDDGVVRLWDLSGQGMSLQAVWAFEGHKGAVVSVSFSPDARWALSAGRDGLRLWELDWEFVLPEPAHRDEGEKPSARIFGVRSGIVAAAAALLIVAAGSLGYRRLAGSAASRSRTIAAGSVAGVAVGMVRIPAGEFLSGGPLSDAPAHRVYLGVYQIDRREVTVAQYREFAQATGRPVRKQPRWSMDQRPIVNVDWNDANAYCAWAGKRLPTEAEWEKAASYLARKDIEAWRRGPSDATASKLSGPAGNETEWVADKHDGSSANSALKVSTAARRRDSPSDRSDRIGFRCARTPIQ